MMKTKTSHRRAKSHDATGFTIVEALVAFSILGMVAAGAYGAAHAAMIANGKIHNRLIAYMTAQSILASIGHVHPVRAGIIEGREQPWCMWRAFINPAPEKYAGRMGAKLYEIKVEVKTGSGKMANAFFLATLKYGSD